jgi:hypothetical protein
MNMKKSILASILTLILLLPILPPQAPCVAGESSRGGTFLPMGWDAKGEGLGGAATILIRDDRSAYWNPANLTFLMSPSLSLGITEPVPDLDNRYSIFSVGTGLFEVRSQPGSEAAMRRLGIALTATHLGLELAGGSGWSESSLGISGAFAPNHYNSLGFTWRMLKSWTDLDDANAWGYALDLGWTGLLRSRLRLGVVGRNIISGISYPQRDEEIDPTWNIASAYEGIFEKISTECDAVLKGGKLIRFLTGVELMIWKDVLFTVGGVDFRLSEGKRTILHIGFGSIYRSSEISLAFRFDPDDALGRQTRISISHSL